MFGTMPDPVYNFLQVQRATEHLLQRIHKPGEASIPKLDFARPKLVQITVSDVGVCIPLTASPMNTDSRPKGTAVLPLG